MIPEARTLRLISHICAVSTQLTEGIFYLGNAEAYSYLDNSKSLYLVKQLENSQKKELGER